MLRKKDLSSVIKLYYSLTKPGIIYGNAITAVGGFFLASKGQINLGLFIAMLLGLTFVIASACVFNNYLDRGIDKKMARTKKRALATGLIPEENAIIYAIILILLGVLVLAHFTNFVTLVIALAGFFFYVIVYTYAKRYTKYGTIIGSISGAIPPVVGYTSVSNTIDLGAMLLFLILVLWQMPHFYAIALYRLNDYKAASIPVLPIKEGVFRTKLQMLFYIFAFLVAVDLLSFFHYTGMFYLTIMTVLIAGWFIMGLRGFKKNTVSDAHWGRKMFFFSLIIILALSIMMSVDASFF